MKKRFGRRARRHKYFSRLYDDNPEWKSNHANDLRVFRKIRREAKRTGKSPLAILRRMSSDPLWAERLKGKSLPSWKRSYNRWHNLSSQKRTHVKATPTRFPTPQTSPLPS